MVAIVLKIEGVLLDILVIEHISSLIASVIIVVQHMALCQHASCMIIQNIKMVKGLILVVGAAVEGAQRYQVLNGSLINEISVLKWT